MAISWGANAISVDETFTVELGKLALSIRRSKQEWTAEFQYRQDRYVNESSQETTRIRTVFGHTDELIELVPATADRNVMVKPSQTIQVPPNESTTLFISTPVWVSGRTSTQVPLFDLPSEILSDCWFGPNTREGELCYSNPTQARMYLELLPEWPERVVTPATIKNEGDETLMIDRLSLPLALLSLYRVQQSFWTQEIVITNTGKLDKAVVELEANPPGQHPNAELIAGARRDADENMMTRALHLLFN